MILFNSNQNKMPLIFLAKKNILNNLNENKKGDFYNISINDLKSMKKERTRDWLSFKIINIWVLYKITQF